LPTASVVLVVLVVEVEVLVEVVVLTDVVDDEDVVEVDVEVDGGTVAGTVVVVTARRTVVVVFGTVRRTVVVVVFGIVVVAGFDVVVAGIVVAGAEVVVGPGGANSHIETSSVNTISADPSSARRSTARQTRSASSTSSRKWRISLARKRRWPPSVRIAEILPARAQRVTVFGLTRNIAATSEGVNRVSSLWASIASALVTRELPSHLPCEIPAHV